MRKEVVFNQTNWIRIILKSIWKKSWITQGLFVVETIINNIDITMSICVL